MRALRSTCAQFLISGLLFLGAAGAVAGETPAATPPGRLLFETGGGALQPAPVLGSLVHLRVTGTVARATVTQIFANPSSEWLEAIYLFPLAQGAAVDGLHLRVGERVIEGRIEERQEAQKTYRTAAAEGRKATLLVEEQADLFTTRVANVGPGERVEVKIELQQEVRWTAGHFELRFPTVVAPHYEPRIPAPAGEQPLSCPRPQPLLAGGGAPGDPVGFRVDLDPGFPLARLASPSHEIAATEERGGGWTVELADRTVPADADFVLDWWPRAGREPRAVAYAHTVDGEPYALLMVMPPAAVSAPVRLPRETVFVIDTSGSMNGPRLEQARAALVSALGRLEPQDRFNVIRFSTVPEPLFPTAVPADPATVEQAEEWVAALEVNGGTEMLAALEAALSDDGGGDNLRQVIFITDGEVGREADLFRYISRHLGRSRLFTVGIGAAPNAHFMERAARFGRGTYTYVDDLGDVEGKMTALFARLEAPVLTDLEVDWDGLAAESFPDPIPDLYLGEPVVVAARLPGAVAAAHVSGWREGERWEVTVPLAGAVDSPAVARLWARKKVAALMDSLTEGGADGDAAAGPDAAKVRDEVVQIGLRHRLVTAYTSLVAVEETPSAPPGTLPVARRVAVNPPRDSGSWSDPGVQEVITVTSESPLLDERRLAVGTTISQGDLDRIPTARDPWSLLQRTPGVMVDRLDVGGLDAPAVAGAAAPPAQTTWTVDGVTIGGSGAGSGASAATYYSFDGLEEMRVDSGAGDVQAATPGARVDPATRHGTGIPEPAPYDTQEAQFYPPPFDSDSPPVPMEVENWVIGITGQSDATTPAVVSTYPADGAGDVFEDAVVKVVFSEPVTGVSASTLTLQDSQGLAVPAFVNQVGDGTWALFPHDVFLARRETYTATLAAGVCDFAGNCTGSPTTWIFTITRDTGGGTGDTSVPLGFPANGGGGNPAPTVTAINPPDGATNVDVNTNVVATFSEPVTNVDATTFLLNEAGGNGKNCDTLGAAVAGTLSSNGDGSEWTFDPAPTLATRTVYCVTLTTGIEDLSGQPLAAPFASQFKTANH